MSLLFFLCSKFPVNVPERIVSYYRHNEVNQFLYLRTKKQPDGSTGSECYELECNDSMPYMLEWAAVNMDRIHVRIIDRIESAYNDINKKNIELRVSLDAYQLTKKDTNNKQQDLQRGVKGIVDAAIGGGISQYADLFDTNNHLQPQDFARNAQLKKLYKAIMIQHSMASEGMKCLKRVMCIDFPDLTALYEFMENQFRNYSQVGK